MDVHSLLRQSDAAEFPVVESEASLLLIGSVPRHGLEQLLAKQLLNPTRLSQARAPLPRRAPRRAPRPARAPATAQPNPLVQACPRHRPPWP